MFYLFIYKTVCNTDLIGCLYDLPYSLRNIVAHDMTIYICGRLTNHLKLEEIEILTTIFSSIMQQN